MFYLQIEQSFAVRAPPKRLTDIEVDPLPFVLPLWLDNGEMILEALLTPKMPIAFLAMLKMNEIYSSSHKSHQLTFHSVSSHLSFWKQQLHLSVQAWALVLS